MTTAQQLVVGIFQDQSQAELAIDELVRAGFDQSHIDFAGPRPAAPKGGILEQIKSLFTGQDVSSGWLYHDLMSMGVSPEETRYYQSEFEAGRSIVAVHGNMGIQMASLILARNGGYGANRNAASSADYDQRTGMQEPAQEDVNAQPRRSPYDYDQRTGMQEPAQEDVNAQPRRPAVDYDQSTGMQQPAQEDVNAQPRRSPYDYGQSTGMQEPAQEDVNAQPRRSPYDYDQRTGMQEPTQEDINAQPRRSTLDSDQRTGVQKPAQEDVNPQPPRSTL